MDNKKGRNFELLIFFTRFLLSSVSCWLKKRVTKQIADSALHAFIILGCSFVCPACQKRTKSATSNFSPEICNPEIENQFGRKILITNIRVLVFDVTLRESNMKQQFAKNHSLHWCFLHYHLSSSYASDQCLLSVNILKNYCEKGSLLNTSQVYSRMTLVR